MKFKFIKSILFSTIGVLSTSIVTPIVLSSCNKKQIPVQSVELDERLLMLGLGDSYKLTATVLPKNATNKKVTWSSSDESIATVDQNGNVKAISEGNATITVITKDGNKKVTCAVGVIKKIIHVIGVSLDKDKLELPEGETDQLTATVLPEDATNKNVSWSSSDVSVATVDENGRVKAISGGNATITVTTEDSKKTATCEVTVTKKVIPVTSVSLDNNRLDLIEGETDKLTATVLPENATNKNVTWSSLKSSIATVDQSGFVTAKAPGNVEIAVTTKDGWHTATCKVTVTAKAIPVTSVILDKKELELVEGETDQLTATVLPEDATNKNVTWSSSNESVATVDENGNVKAISEGNATITVTTEDGSKTATCAVTVTKKVIPVTSVTLDKDKLELPEGETAQLTATVLPENATNKNVIWSSSNESIVIVDQNGNVTAKTPGNAAIIVTTEDGSKSDTCEVTVTEKIIHATSVKLDNSKLFLNLDESYKLTATIFPENATNKNVTWTTSTPSIAIVDQNGNVAGKGTGTATIKVTTKDGGYTDFCDVIVTNNISVKGITLDKDKLELFDGGVAKLTATVLPEDATNKNVIWNSLDTSIATVDQNGNVTVTNPKGISALTTITVTTEDGGYIARCIVIAKPGVTPGPAVKVGESYGIWGDITVKYKLYSNHECRLLTKFMGADSENGYVDGTGILRIPDHVVWNGENYYVERIPSEWSDGSNNIDGIEFDNVSHLKEICDYAFKGTDALNNYDRKICKFPEGLEYIGTEAFYNVDRMNDLVMGGLDFPSTLNAINVRAFANAGLLGEYYMDQRQIDVFAKLTFRGNFNPENMREKAFSPIIHKHFVKYIYAPTIEIATNIANYIRVCYEDDFYGSNYHKKGLVIPKVIGS